MKRISCWQDLKSYGIDALTGEACGLSYRILFDATERGRKILAKAFGIPNLKLAEPWNRGSTDDPHVGSILLPHEMLTLVSVFALLESGCTVVWLYTDNTLRGIEPSDPPERIAAWRRMAAETIVRTFGYRGTAGDRNCHVASGRID